MSCVHCRNENNEPKLNYLHFHFSSFNYLLSIATLLMFLSYTQTNQYMGGHYFIHSILTGIPITRGLGLCLYR